MRDLDNRDLITGDFILVSGDVVSNLDLRPALAQHKARRQKDKNAIMTMILRETGIVPGMRRRERRPLFVIDPRADRCVHFEEVGGNKTAGARFMLDPDFLKEHGEIEIREDLVDCRIDICTPEILAQWSENFDYQSPRTSFLFGVLKDYELNGKTIHTYVVTNQYASRVKDFKGYMTVSKDVTNGWTYPFNPEGNFLGDQTYLFTANKCYIEDNVAIARTARVSKRSVIGTQTSIGENAAIMSTCVGRRCKIGPDVHIEDSYLWDDVVVEAGAVIRHSIIANGSIIGSQCKIDPGSLISFKSHIPNTTTTSSAFVPSTTKDDATATPYDATDSDSDFSEPSLFAYQQPSATSSRSSISTITSETALNGDADEDDDNEYAAGTAPLDGAAAAAFADDLADPFEDPEAAAAAADAARAFHAEASSSILDGLRKGDAADTIFLELNGYRMSVDASQHAVRAAVVAAFMQRVAQLVRGDSANNDDDDEDDNAKTFSNTPTTLTPKAAVTSVFTAYKSLLERILSSSITADPTTTTTTTNTPNTESQQTTTNQIDFLLDLQRQCAHWPPFSFPSHSATTATLTTTNNNDSDEGSTVLLFATTELWQLGLVDEDGLVAWWDDVRSSGGAGGTGAGGKGGPGVGERMAAVRTLTGKLVQHVREMESESESDEDDEEEEEEEDE